VVPLCNTLLMKTSSSVNTWTWTRRCSTHSSARLWQC